MAESTGAYIRADNPRQELAELMVATGMSYFEIRHHLRSQDLVRKMAHGLQPSRLFWKTAGFLLQLGFRKGRSR